MSKVEVTVIHAGLKGNKALKAKEKRLNHTLCFMSPNHQLSALPYLMFIKLYSLYTKLKQNIE